jgi:hypothetical protein
MGMVCYKHTYGDNRAHSLKEPGAFSGIEHPDNHDTVVRDFIKNDTAVQKRNNYRS